MSAPESFASQFSGTAEHVRAAILAGGHHVVHGAPGSGKSTTAIVTFTEYVNRAEQAPGEAVLLVPTRRRAAAVRDEVSARLHRTTGSVLVRTPASLAFAIVRLRASYLGEPAPTLVTGPEQDQVLAELLAGHAHGDGGSIGWPDSVTAETLGLRAFRNELRDLLMRAAEAGLDGEALTAVGEREGRPLWSAAGRVLTEYTHVMALGQTTPDRGARYDAATIVDEAVLALHSWEEVVTNIPRPQWSLVMHDDYQDATLATARLLHAMVGDGARVAVFGDPDLAVQQFRGGVPALMRTASLPPGVAGAWGAQEHVLDRVWRHPEPIRSAVQTLTAALPALGKASRRRVAAVPGEPESEQQGSVRAVLLATQAQQVAYIARHLREQHVYQQRAWSQMVVIVRSTSLVGTVRRGLRTAGVPLAVASADRPLRDEPAVRPLLVSLHCAVVGGVAPADAATLLMSPIAGLDAVGVRALRRALRQTERREGGQRRSEDLLGDLFSPAVQQGDSEGAAVGDLPVAGLPERLQRAVAAVQAVLAAGFAELGRTDATVETILWGIWEASGLAPVWQRRALAGGVAGERADTDLDAVMALFRAAEQFTDRSSYASPATFLEYLAAQDFPADTLAAHGNASEAVAVHTPAGAAGGQWGVVVVAGVQDDTWPDLRIRDSLLGAAQLADLATERHVRTADSDAADQDQFRRARKEVYEGELRAFVSACSRAREDLLVTAVLDTDARPSIFVETLLPDTEELPGVTPVEAPLDLRGLVGRLRSKVRPLLDGAGDHDQADLAAAESAVEVLAYLGAQNVHGAVAQQWPIFRDPSTARPLWEAHETVTVSPSSLEDVTTCPLRWALTRHGGKPGDSVAQSLGNLVHEIAAEYPAGTEEELLNSFNERWHELELSDAWVGRRERERGERIIRKLAQYIVEHTDQDVEPEASFDVDVDGVRLRGRADRVEHTSTGLRIVDLKTGKSAVTKAEADRHAQLGSYQVAVARGAFGDHPLAGAALVYLGSTTKSVTQRSQAPLTEDPNPAWAQEMVREGAATMAAAEFEARPNPMCRFCPVRNSCPAHSAGDRVGSTGGNRE